MKLRPDVAATETDYGMVLLDGRDGNYWHLNDTGAEIVRLLLDGRDRAGVVRHLVAEYQISRAQAERDVRGLIDDMVESGMVLP